MPVRRLRVLATLAVSLLAASELLAHGGGYRPPPPPPPRRPQPGGHYGGPGDVVGPKTGGGPRKPGPTGPSTPGPSGPATPGPAGPATPGPSGPTTPGPAGPATPGPGRGPAGGPSTGGGIVLEEDHTRWQHWWYLNRDAFLRVREALRAEGAVTNSDAFFMGAGRVRAVDALGPTDTIVRNDVAPRLRRLMERDADRDLETACLMALAKVGADRADFDVLPILTARLRRGDQEVRETAALAIGVSRHPRAGEMLAGLVADDQAGRALVGGSAVDERCRAFAAYGLGLFGRAGTDDERELAFEALHGSIVDGDQRPDLRAAAILAVGILAPEGRERMDRRLHARALHLLGSEWDTDRGAGREPERAHAATSIARLLRHHGSNALISFHAGRFVECLGDERASDDRRRAAALALGLLGSGPGSDSAVADGVCTALMRAWRDVKDFQTRAFVLIALGRIGGENAREFLLDVLARGTRAIERPWAALALGVLVRSHDLEDPVAVLALRAQLDSVKTPQARAAFALGLGLCGDASVADDLRAVLADVEHQDEVAGHVCVALALLRDARSIEPLRELARASLRRPQRLQEAAVSLGALGDRNAAETLMDLLREGRPSLTRVAAVSAGLGLIGDRRSLEPLLEIAEDESATDLARAFAVVAVGGIVQRGDLPWNEPLAPGLNYRAALPTLYDGLRGVLDVH